MKRIIVIVMVLSILLALPVMGNAATGADIPDEKLEAALKQICGKGPNEIVTAYELRSLTGTVDLSNKGITDISGIHYLTGATAINLSRNDVETFSTKMDRLVNLKELNLSFNDQGYSFPSEITNIPNLETLNLSANKMQRIPNTIKKLKGLKNLDLSANRFQDFPEVLKDITFENLNMDYNFFDLSEGSDDLKDIDAARVTGNYLVYRQLNKLSDISYSTKGRIMTVKWIGLEDIPFYDGTFGEVVGYTILVNGKFRGNVEANVRSFSFAAKPWTYYTLSVSPRFSIRGYDDFYNHQYTVRENCMLGYTGPVLSENPEGILYENAYAASKSSATLKYEGTPTPTPEPTATTASEPVAEATATAAPEPTATVTPTQEPTPTPTPTPTVEPTVKATPVTSVSVSPEPEDEGVEANTVFTLILLIIILLLILVIAGLLAVILRNKNLQGEKTAQPKEKAPEKAKNKGQDKKK